MWHMESSSGPQPKYFRLWSSCGNLHFVVGLGFHIDINKEILKKSSCPKF